LKKLKPVLILMVFLCALSGCKKTDGQQQSVEEEPETSVVQETSAVLSSSGSAPESSEEEPSSDAEPVPELSTAPPPVSSQPSFKPPVPQSSVPTSAPEPAVEADASGAELDTGAVERELLRLVNIDREEMAIEQLGLEDSMQWAARIRAEEVLVLLMHTRPNGMPYNTAFDDVGFGYAGKLHGENIATFQFSGHTYTNEEIAQIIFDKLKSSSGHSLNMFSDKFVQVGIGVYIQQNGDSVRVGVAQLFLGL